MLESILPSLNNDTIYPIYHTTGKPFERYSVLRSTTSPEQKQVYPNENGSDIRIDILYPFPRACLEEQSKIIQKLRTINACLINSLDIEIKSGIQDKINFAQIFFDRNDFFHAISTSLDALEKMKCIPLDQSNVNTCISIALKSLDKISDIFYKDKTRLINNINSLISSFNQNSFFSQEYSTSKREDPIPRRSIIISESNNSYSFQELNQIFSSQAMHFKEQCKNIQSLKAANENLINLLSKEIESNILDKINFAQIFFDRNDFVYAISASLLALNKMECKSIDESNVINCISMVLYSLDKISNIKYQEKNIVVNQINSLYKNLLFLMIIGNI